ncbi:hypothetical protein [Mucilaginibacter terrae]|uniref:Ig-like domain-containing protein n=1 Tax=Mucilaginibacter terrae TaxID=1955052 RepID=A0ABU3H083_9SPHI|nr:hypothetical protein [Mucilaginibacter terrae]MDT3405096.1 hypothetical protein [Mucilaginibacter terrae]
MANQPAGFQFAKPYDPTNPVASDMRYGKYDGTTTIPFTNIAEALDLIKPALRYQGLQCIIANGTSISLFWFRGGTANNDLVLLQTDVNISGKEDNANKTNSIRDLANADNTRYPSELAVRTLTDAATSPPQIKAAYESNSNTNAFTNAQKAKLDSVLKAFTLSFTQPVREYKDYFENTVTINSIIGDGTSVLRYSTNGGSTYSVINLPYNGSLSIPVGWIRWRIDYASQTTTTASVYIKLQ